MLLSVVAILLVVQFVVIGAEHHDVEGCGLYLAESSVKDGGWGVFAGRDFAEGEPVEEPGIGIQVIDSDQLDEESSVLKHFLWRSTVAGGYGEAEKVSTFFPGVGSLANFHPSLANVLEGSFRYDPFFQDRNHPSAGAISAYHNYSFIASKEIRAGDEIFTGTYDLHKEKRWKGFSTAQDYARAASILEGVKGYRRKHPTLTDIQWIDILYRMKNEMLVEDKIETVGSLLPNSLDELLRMEENGLERGALFDRDLQQIKKNGYCLDNIRQGESTIPSAGRGAFATRAITGGDVVLPMPLMPINSSAFHLQHRGPAANATVQLLENYCYGNQHTPSVRFCPLTQASLINHRHHSAKPNAGLRWAKPSSNRVDGHRNLLLESLEDIQNIFKVGARSPRAPLMMEVYALRNIDKDEEVLIDYSEDWEDAFRQHADSHQSTNGDESSVRISRTAFSKADNVVASDELTAGQYECRLEPLSSERFPGIMTEEDYRSRDQQYPDNYVPRIRLLFGENEFAMWFPCTVFEQINGAVRVEVFSRTLETRRAIRQFFNLPLEALRLVEAPYQSDQHKADAFRHFIPIPDALFPARWRSDYMTSKDLRLGKVSEGMDAAAEENKHLLDEHEQRLREAKCGLYFAPSNIPEAGFSSYTAVPYEGKSIVIGSTLPAIVLPGVYSPNLETWDMKDYVWIGRAYNAEYEVGSDYTSEVMGASLANFHPGILNMGLKRSELRPILDRCVDPGAGASTDYLGCAFESKLEMQPGEEMFISYGDSWFLQRQEFGNIAVSYNYDESNTMLASLWGLMGTSGLSLRPAEVANMLVLFKEKFIKDKRSLSAMARVKTVDDVERVVARNGTAQAEMNLRSLEWLEDNGQCMDHIYIARSTIPQAGQGAFSRRLLKQGQTIISSPLVHTWGREYFDMDLSNITDKVNPTLQVLNYQFTHADTNAYFLPINQAIAINHGSNRMQNDRTANAEIRWALWDKRSSYYLERPLEDLKQEHHSTMIIDIVATREILVDEEVLIDYGPAWENAWLKHLEEWRSPCTDNTQSSKRIVDMNNDKHNESHWSWTDNHFSICWDDENSVVSTIYIAVNETSASESESQKFKIVTNYEGIAIGHEGFYLARLDTNRMPCLITNSRSKGRFDVIRFISWDVDHEVRNAEMIQIHEDFPSNYLLFLPKPWKSDMHWEGAFRHPIAIPDHVFPMHWRQEQK